MTGNYEKLDSDGQQFHQYQQNKESLVYFFFSLSVFYLSQNNKLEWTQVQRTYEISSYIQFYNNTKPAK
jgi:hypothetical protein